jgi:hypothetical protein
MSERDLPKRIAKDSKYETFPVLVTGMESFEELADIALRPDTESYVTLKRVALTQEQTPGLVSFSVEEKKGDTRYKWFKANHGDRCWELDAMDPNDLRDCVEREIKALIEPVAWKRCEVVNEAERTNLETTLKAWSKDPTAQDSDFWITEWMQED